MPKATADIEEIIHKDLKTLTGGFVKFRRMTYGQIVQRRAMSKMQMTTTKGQRSFAGELAMSNKDITLFEFQHCIVEHNLEDATGRPLNFHSEKDFDSLDPRIGQEIESVIQDMNEFDINEEDVQGE